jgi:hypothetical protein
MRNGTALCPIKFFKELASALGFEDFAIDNSMYGVMFLRDHDDFLRFCSKETRQALPRLVIKEASSVQSYWTALQFSDDGQYFRERAFLTCAYNCLASMAESGKILECGVWAPTSPRCYPPKTFARSPRSTEEILMQAELFVET